MNNTDKTKHTGLPWKLSKYNPTYIESLEDEFIATTKFESWNTLKRSGELEEAKANANLIVTAVNSYHKDQEAIGELVDALEGMVEELAQYDEDDDREAPCIIEARKLLTKHQQGGDDD